jgi:uncharacterized protein (TIGR02145 family)
MISIKPALLAGISLAFAFTFSCSSGNEENDTGSSSSLGGAGGSSSSLGGGNLPSSSSAGDNGGGDSVDYEGQTYKTVKIGTQTWMAENLNYAVAGSKCYGEGGEVVVDWDEENRIPIATKTLSPAEVQANCVTYGRLYDWSTAMNLPSSCNSNSCSNQIQSPHRGICPSGWHIPSNDDWDKLYRHADGTSGTESPYDSLTAGKHLKAQSGWNPYSGIENLDTYGFLALPGGYYDYLNGDFNGAGRLGNWWSASEYENYGCASFQYMYYSIDNAYWSFNDKSYLFSVRCLQD